MTRRTLGHVPPWTLAALAALAPVSLGCSVILDTAEEQCQTDQDCDGRGPAFAGSVCVQSVCQPGSSQQDPRWSCLGQVQWPAAQPGTMLDYRAQIIELNSQLPPAGLEVLVCTALDIDCNSPIAGPLTVDEQGWLDTQLESGFSGYLEVTSPTTVPAMIYQGRPLTESVSDPLPIQILTPASFQLLAQFGGYTIEPGRGHALILAMDCNEQTAAGVQLSTDQEDPAVLGFYLIDQFPDPNAVATDSSGNGGFINLPEDWVTISSSVQATGAHIGSTRLTIRADTIAYVSAIPTPEE